MRQYLSIATDNVELASDSCLEQRVVDGEGKGQLASGRARREREERRDDGQRSHDPLLAALPSQLKSGQPDPEAQAPGTHRVPGARWKRSGGVLLSHTATVQYHRRWRA